MPGPLGIKDDVEITDEQRCTLRYIEDFDLGEAVKAAVEADEIDARQARSAEREVKRFLALAYLEEADAVGMAPSRKVDSVWHQFILNTREYMRFSYRVFGRFLHHVPTGREEAPREMVPGEGRGAARPGVKEYFEDVDEDFWSGEAFICWIYLRPRP